MSIALLLPSLSKPTQALHKTAAVLSFLAIAATATANTPAPVLHYQFNEGPPALMTLDTGTAPQANGKLPASGYWSNNTPAGNAVAGKYALRLIGGPNDYLDAGQVSKLDGLNAFTITAWINLQGPLKNSDRILSTKGQDSTGGIDLMFSATSSNHQDISEENFTLSLTVNNSTVSMTRALSAKQRWVFIAVAFNGNAASGAPNVAFYAGNSTPSGSAQQRGNALTIPQSVVLPGGGAFRVGGTDAVKAGTPRSPMIWIDDLRIYPAALNSQQVRDVQAAGLSAN